MNELQLHRYVMKRIREITKAANAVSTDELDYWESVNLPATVFGEGRGDTVGVAMHFLWAEETNALELWVHRDYSKTVLGGNHTRTRIITDTRVCVGMTSVLENVEPTNNTYVVTLRLHNGEYEKTHRTLVAAPNEATALAQAQLDQCHYPPSWVAAGCEDGSIGMIYTKGGISRVSPCEIDTLLKYLPLSHYNACALRAVGWEFTNSNLTR